MANKDDKAIDLTEEEVKTVDADLPVDANAEAENAHVAKSFDKKKIAGLGIVVGLVIVAGIVVFSLSQKPTDIDTSTTPLLLAERPPVAPPKVGKMPTPPKPVSPKKPPATVDPNKPVTGALARPGDANWVKGVQKPLPVPNGLQATPGLEGSNTPQVKVVTGKVGASNSASASSKGAAMKRLWNSGAAAKHRGDYAGARKDWKRILELDPGHAGIQEAINKLPKK